MNRKTERDWPFYALLGCLLPAFAAYSAGPLSQRWMAVVWMLSTASACTTYGLARDLYARVRSPSYWRHGLLLFERQAGLAGDVLLQTRMSIQAAIVAMAGAAACGIVCATGSERPIHLAICALLVGYGRAGGLPGRAFVRKLWDEEDRMERSGRAP